jgi:Bcr/CflA subfamily drug resistance transporter
MLRLLPFYRCQEINVNKQIRIIKWMIILLIPIQQMSIDIYLPSLPRLDEVFQATNAQSQMTISLYLLGLAIVQPIFGPLSDRYGRKPVVIFGLTVFLLATISSIFSVNMKMLLISRLVQGLGAGSSFVTVSAILSDSFRGKDLAHMTSICSIVYALPSIIAPVIGGYLQHWFDWQASFYFLFVAALLMIVLIVFLLPETNRDIGKHPISLKPYAKFFRSISFLGCLSCLLFTFSVMIVFSVLSPFILQDHFGISVVHYGQIVLLIGLAYLIGTVMNNRLLHWISSNSIVLIGCAIMFIGSFALLAVNYFGHNDAMWTTVLTAVTVVGTGFIFPNCYAYCLGLFPGNAGFAAALIGSVSLLGVFSVSAIISHINASAMSRLIFGNISMSVLTLFGFSIAMLRKSQHGKRG